MVFESFDMVFLTCLFLLPGFIIKSIVSSFVPPRREGQAKYLLSCLSYSIISFLLYSWFYYLLLHGLVQFTFLIWIKLITISLPGAAVIGFILSFIKQKNYIKKSLDKMGIKNFHQIPNAWDYYFAQQKPAWVIITFHDNKKIYGMFGGQSFASSDLENQDIYLEKTYNIDNESKWIEINKIEGVLISRSNIKMIEFYS